MQLEDFETLAASDNLELRLALTPQGRSQVLAFIRQQFMTHYDALVDDDAPSLIGGFDVGGDLIAAFGLRRAQDGFFCERYLQAPLEVALARHYQVAVADQHVVEVAHLCAIRPGFLGQLMPLLALRLQQGGFRYLACTATACLARFFLRNGLPAIRLADADPGCLESSERRRWGRYYEKRPEVIAGDLDLACRLLQAQRLSPIAVET
jgi:hypothetical protein